MKWSTFIPGSSTLVILFRLARARLSASPHDVSLLTDERLVSATEEMQKISDDLRDAEDTETHTDTGEPKAVGSSDAELPVESHTPLVAPDAWADFRHFSREIH
jgi:hypothetical protein